MLDDVQDRIQAWLDHEPTISALEVLARLKAAQLGTILQRAVKAWRGQQARRIVMASSIAISAGLSPPLHAEHV